MNEEINKIIKNIEERLCLHRTIKEPISGDLDKAIKLSVAYEDVKNILDELKIWLKDEIKKQSDISKYNLSKLPTNREKTLKDVLNKIKYLEKSNK